MALFIAYACAESDCADELLALASVAKNQFSASRPHPLGARAERLMGWDGGVGFKSETRRRDEMRRLAKDRDCGMFILVANSISLFTDNRAKTIAQPLGQPSHDESYPPFIGFENAFHRFSRR